MIDIAIKAAEDPNAVVTPEDLVAFERRHGRIPPRALVCMNSGWSAKVDDGDAFRGGTGFPDFNLPGFSVDATDWLVARRDPVGIGLDTTGSRRAGRSRSSGRCLGRTAPVHRAA